MSFDIFLLETLKFKIQSKLNQYTPPLIANLSERANDLYIIRRIFYQQLLKILDESSIENSLKNSNMTFSDYVRSSIRQIFKSCNPKYAQNLKILEEDIDELFILL
ncbi:hypothetical protein [Candidatus Harpocratesius sp.]